MEKINIKLETHGLNFYWADKGYVDENNIRLKCSWEDIDFGIYVNGKMIGEYSTTIDTKEYFKNEISELKGDFGRSMEEKCPGYIYEELNDTTFGFPMEKIVDCNEIVLGFCYDDITNENKYETKIPKAPYNEFGMKPSYIVIFNPCDSLNRTEVEKSIQFYIEKMFDFGDDMEFHFEWINTPSDNDLNKEWKQYQKDINYWNRMKLEGVKPEIVFSKELLSQLFGEEAMKPYIEKGMVSGKPIDEDMQDIMLTFSDGHKEVFRDIDDLFLDHFKELDME